MVEILALVLHHDEEAVLSAVELALESGVPSKLHVLNLLGRRVRFFSTVELVNALELEKQADK